MFRQSAARPCYAYKTGYFSFAIIGQNSFAIYINTMGPGRNNEDKGALPR